MWNAISLKIKTHQQLIGISFTLRLPGIVFCVSFTAWFSFFVTLLRSLLVPYPLQKYEALNCTTIVILQGSFGIEYSMKVDMLLNKKTKKQNEIKPIYQPYYPSNCVLNILFFHKDGFGIE